jgi:hypothetical protein
VQGGKLSSSSGGVDEELIVRHRRAALHVPEPRIPGETELAREEAQAINFAAKRQSWIESADTRPVEIRPIALGLHTDHKMIVRQLPAIADLAADDAAGPIMTAISKDRTNRQGDVPAIVALGPAAVPTDVEA